MFFESTCRSGKLNECMCCNCVHGNVKGGRGFLKPCKRHLTNRMRMRYKPQAAVLVIVRVHRYPE